MSNHRLSSFFFFFFFNDTATTEIYTLSLHDALPIWSLKRIFLPFELEKIWKPVRLMYTPKRTFCTLVDRKSTRLNSSHANISYAVFCLKKKKNDRTVQCFILITDTDCLPSHTGVALR